MKAPFVLCTYPGQPFGECIECETFDEVLENAIELFKSGVPYKVYKEVN